MKFTELLKRIIPSYRVRNEVMARINNLERNVNRIYQQIEDQNEKNEYMFWLLQKQENETLEQTKKRVFLDLPKATGTLRDLQLAENYLLVRLKEICDQNNFLLCLAAGTLLGAVRHHGFIPWDDDIDTYMLREDALKLFDIIKDDDDIAIHHYYRRSGDHVIKLKYRFSDSVFIDIFTFDRIECAPENRELIWKQTQEAAHRYEDQMMSVIESNPSLRFNDKGIPTWLPELDKFVEVEFDKVVSKMDFYGWGNSLCQSIYDGYAYRSPLGIGIFKEEELLPLLKEEVEFEGMKYDAFLNYKELLNMQYGDIWRFPSKIFSHHLYEMEEGLEDAIKQIKQKQYI